jgi:hypothetical protein
MLRRLGSNWWTSFGFFVAAVAISSGMTLYRIGFEEARYRDLFAMIVDGRALQRDLQPTPAPAAPSTAGEPTLDLARDRPLDI